MRFIKGDYFSLELGEFDGIITDIPYKGAIPGKLGEAEFDFGRFVEKAWREIKDDGFLISFTNFLYAVDLINSARAAGFTYRACQIWDKRPTRTWISWSLPIRHTEFIIYLLKGDFKFDFRDGTIKPGVSRSSFGGDMRRVEGRENEQSQGMFEEIISISGRIKRRRHPTEKPRDFSHIFARVVGTDKQVLDPFCGTGNLLDAFPNATGVDLMQYNKQKRCEDYT